MTPSGFAWGSVGCADWDWSVGGGELPGTVGLLDEVPVGVVNQMVMFGTDRNQVVEICWAAVLPWFDVVDFAHVKVAVTPANDAGVIQAA